MANKKKTPTTTGSIWFKDPKLPTKEELVAYAKDMDKKYPGDTHTRGFLRQKLQIEIGVTDPWEKLGMNWAQFKRECDFAPSRAASKLINQSSKHAEADRLRSASEERLSWGDIYTKPDNGEDITVVMGAGDFHDKECDPFAWRMWMEKLRAVQPDIISIHGDMFDAPEFSKHIQDPREYDLRGRIKIVHDMFGEMREACPDAQIDLIEGNHEARIHRHILEMNPATADILTYFHGLGIRELLGLDEFEVNYIAKGDLFAFSEAQLKKVVLESEAFYEKLLWVRHHPPKKDHVAYPGFHGHHHAHRVETYWDPGKGSFEWHQLGGMHIRQASYTDGRKWNNGFITAYIDKKMHRVNFDYTYVGDTSCILGGKFFERYPEEYYEGLKADLENRASLAGK